MALALALLRSRTALPSLVLWACLLLRPPGASAYMDGIYNSKGQRDPLGSVPMLDRTSPRFPVAVHEHVRSLNLQPLHPEDEASEEASYPMLGASNWSLGFPWRRALAARNDARQLLLAKAAWGTSFKQGASWKASNPCSKWFGVRCTGKGFIVVALSLANQGLRGKLPASLGNLPSLTYMNLSSTIFTQRNVFTGAIPNSFNRLNRLQVLVLANAGLSGKIPLALAGLRSLQVLALPGNSLTGALPARLNLVPQLQVLDLGYNALTGTIPPAITSLRKLQYLALIGNKLTGKIPLQFGNMVSLTYMILSGNKLAGPIPASMSRLARLRVLALGYNKLSGAIPAGLGRLSNLFAMTLPSNALTGGIPPQLANMKNLGIFDVSYNRLSGLFPGRLSLLAKLQVLLVNANLLSGTLPSLTGMPNLRLLSFGNNRFSGAIPGTIGRLTALTRLVLFKNALQGQLPNIWPRLAHLTTADLSSNQLTGNPPLPKSSVTLVLTNNFFTGAGCLKVKDGTLNCRTGCAKQKTAATCSAFCGTTSRAGACAGKGTCGLVRGKGVCTCVRGYKRSPRNAGTCIKA